MKQLRVDKKLETAVNRGLAAALLAGIRAGTKVMSEEGVPQDVMVRVLLAPHQRRATDWKR
ncbi:MAG TPA: hypothetical protein VF801_17100 [Rhodocyclaceae bacterium]